MPVEIGREEVQRLLREGAQLVEVLGEQAYRKAHLAAAIHISLAALGQQAKQQLQPEQPIIVYCHDST